MGYGTSFWTIGFTLLFGLLFLAGLVLLVVWAARRSSGPPAGQAQASDAALDTARRRFASGEITKEQYDEIQRTLSGY
jgi:uncharacterized membrane protein